LLCGMAAILIPIRYHYLPNKVRQADEGDEDESTRRRGLLTRLASKRIKRHSKLPVRRRRRRRRRR
jgi:hypothetical protein